MKIFLFYICFISLLHEVPISYFSLYVNETFCSIEIEIENDYFDFLSTENEPVKIDQVNHYLNKHFKLSLNGKVVQCNFTDVEILPNGHFLIIGISEKSKDLISEVSVQNTCFLEREISQTNSILIHQESKELRGFKMNQDRTEIYFEL